MDEDNKVSEPMDVEKDSTLNEIKNVSYSVENENWYEFFLGIITDKIRKI